MPSLEAEWVERFETVWDKGQYRQGSTAFRMTGRILELIPQGSTINDYGSGTGRVDVALASTKRYPRINMADVAGNALERDALALLGDGLTFTKAFLWCLPADFPTADWGLCINVLMTIPKEQLRLCLSEIKRTCHNVLIEVYDYEDIRCGYQLTETMGGREFWEELLKEFWRTVVYEDSPESPRRYVFVCSTL